MAARRAARQPIRQCVPRQGGVGGVLLEEVLLPGRPESVAVARRVAVRVGRACGASEDVIENLRTCVSETVTNAVTHATRTPDSVVRVLMIRRRDRLRVEVHDGSARPPEPRCPGPEGEAGRGLIIVGFLTDDHGTVVTPQGKAVWFELAAWPRNSADRRDTGRGDTGWGDTGRGDTDRRDAD